LELTLKIVKVKLKIEQIEPTEMVKKPYPTIYSGYSTKVRKYLTISDNNKHKTIEDTG
jgi:hypothetical protein